MWDKRAKITNVHDGDTVTAVLDQGFGQTTQITVRMLGVFAPELIQVGGIPSRDFVRNWIIQYSTADMSAWPFVITTARGPKSDKEEVTLGRFLAIIETIDHSHNLNADVQDFIIRNGYGGGTGAPKATVSPVTSISSTNPANITVQP